ncbi:DNA polymerase A family protein [Leishmania donovani]|uniref:DNA-directed DNA polymerase n=1 Tax=Leishmania donovani TaxID=5661 RepID=A0A504X9Q7_LEIDO|nr:DNA polymerase A family protein [Leishmania donovani]
MPPKSARRGSATHALVPPALATEVAPSPPPAEPQSHRGRTRQESALLFWLEAACAAPVSRSSTNADRASASSSSTTAAAATPTVATKPPPPPPGEMRLGGDTSGSRKTADAPPTPGTEHPAPLPHLSWGTGPRRLVVADAVPLFDSLLAGRLGPVAVDVQLQGHTRLSQQPQQFEAALQAYERQSTGALREALSSVQPFFLLCNAGGGADMRVNHSEASGGGMDDDGHPQPAHGAAVLSNSSVLYTMDPASNYPVLPLLAQLLRAPQVTKLLLHSRLLYRLLFLFLGTDRVELSSVVDLPTWAALGQQLRPSLALLFHLPIEGVASLSDITAVLPSEARQLLHEETQSMAQKQPLHATRPVGSESDSELDSLLQRIRPLAEQPLGGNSRNVSGADFDSAARAVGVKRLDPGATGVAAPSAGIAALSLATSRCGGDAIASPVSAVRYRFSPSELCALRTYADFLCELMAYHGVFVNDTVAHGMLTALDVQMAAIEDVGLRVAVAVLAATEPAMPRAVNAHYLRLLAAQAKQSSCARAEQLRLGCQLVCVWMAYLDRATTRNRLHDMFRKVADKLHVCVLEKPRDSAAEDGPAVSDASTAQVSRVCYSMHPNWVLHNKSTGRIFSALPNVQNLPKQPPRTTFPIHALSATPSRNSGGDESLHPTAMSTRRRRKMLIGGCRSRRPLRSIKPRRTVSSLSREPAMDAAAPLLRPSWLFTRLVRFNQLELRLLAHLSGDAALQEHLSANVDVLALVTASVLRLPSIDHVRPQQRQAVKVIVYGLLYGMGPESMDVRIKKINEEFATSEQQQHRGEAASSAPAPMAARDLLRRFHRVYPRIENYLRETRQEALRSFAVETLSGRKSLIAEKDANRRRQRAIAQAVQGGAADVLHTASQLSAYLPAAPLALVMSIHDELVYAVPRVAIEEVVRGVQRILEDQARVLRLAVPLPVSARVGHCLGELADFGSVGGAAGSGAPPLIDAPGRGGGVLSTPSNAAFHAAGGPALMSGVVGSSGNTGVLHDHFDVQPGSYSPFGGGSQAVPPPVLGGAVAFKVGEGKSNTASHEGKANVSAGQLCRSPQCPSSAPARHCFPIRQAPSHGAAPAAAMLSLPGSFATTPLSAVPVFAAPPQSSMPTSSGGGILGGGGGSAQSRANLSFTAPRGGQGHSSGNSKESGAKGGADSRPSLPVPHSSHQRSQESLPWLGSTSALSSTPAPTTPFLDRGSAGAGSSPRPLPVFPDVASAARNSDNNKSHTSGNVLATAAPSCRLQLRRAHQVPATLKAVDISGKGGNAAGGPPPLPPTSSVFGTSVPSASASAAPLDRGAATPPFREATPANAAVKGSLPEAALRRRRQGLLRSLLQRCRHRTSAAAVTAPSTITPAASPPPAAAKSTATGANRSGSVFGELHSSFGAPPPTTAAPIFSAFGAVSPVAPGPTPSATPFGQQAAPRGGSHVPASFHASPFAPSPPSAGAASKPATTASAFGSAASGSGPGVGVGSVFTAAAATPVRAPASSFGASAASGKVPPPAPSRPFGSRADGGGDVAAGRRRGRSTPRSDAAEDDGSGSGGPARPHPSSLAATASPSAQGSRLEIPAPRHGQCRPAPSTTHTQKPPTALSQLGKLPIPPLPADEKKLCIAARVCKSFLMQLASAPALGGRGGGAAGSSREEGVAKTLEQAFFGVVGIEGVHGNFGNTAGEMLALWNGQVRPVISGRSTQSSEGGGSAFPGEMWIALFTLGTYLNTILSTLQSSKSGRYAASSSASASVTDLAAYKAGLRAHPTEALTDACHYANELSELLQTLFQRGGEADAPPYSVIPVVLRRVRSVFDEANARGVATVQSNLNTVTSKLFAVLNRRVKTSAVQPLSTPGEAPRWLLTYDSKEKESLLHSFAYLIVEMIAADAPKNDDVELFISAFHECFPSALAERCMLYYRRACALLRQPLRMSLVEEAAELLAKATVVYPPNATWNNRRVLLVKLLATELALGRLPPDEDWLALDVPALTDVVNALKTSRLDLLDAALSMHGPFFVEIGFYLTHGCESRLSVSEMVRYHRLPYSAVDAGVVWLLPLLVEKQINGVLDHDYLILSAKTPFDAYPLKTLADAAAVA